MEFEFSKKTEEFIKIITKTAQTNNVRVFFVGGIVRDNCLKIKTKDIDIIIEGNAIELSKMFPPEIVIKSIHKDFGTVKLQYGNINIDLASTREEKYPYSGCLPEITKLGINIKDDVKRRDFTINSMYAEITLENNVLKYNLIDYTGGKKDIEKKTLKVLHKNSYFDDPTRILRGLNFKYRFDFDFSFEDKKLIKEYINNVNIKKASIDRIKEVFKIILSNEFQDKIFEEIIETKLYKLLNIEILDIDFKKLQNTFLNFDLEINQKADFYFNILLQKNIEIPDFIDVVSKYKFYSKLNKTDKAYLFYLTQNNEINFYSNIKIYMQGKDLIELGFSQGKNIGTILDSLLTAKIKNPNVFLNKNDEINWVLNHFPIE